MNKRIKANLDDIINMNVIYNAYQRVKNNDGIRGTRFILSNPLNNEQMAYFKQFKNVHVGKAHYRYAPQIEYDTLVLFDKCIRGKK